MVDLLPPRPSSAPLVIGHRGAARHAPENTLAGLRAASRAGADWVEFDVRLTRCGRLVLVHDEHLDRTTDGHGPVAARDWLEIEPLDAGRWFGEAFAGERVPTLEAALALLPVLGLAANVEIKTDPARAGATAAALAEVLARSDAAADVELLLSSGEPRVLAELARRVPGLPRALVLEAPPADDGRLARQLGCRAVHVDERALSAPAVAALAEVVGRVGAYTVNDPARARELAAQGVAVLFTDDPGLLLGELPPDDLRSDAHGARRRRRRRPPAA